MYLYWTRLHDHTALLYWQGRQNNDNAPFNCLPNLHTSTLINLHPPPSTPINQPHQTSGLFIKYLHKNLFSKLGPTGYRLFLYICVILPFLWPNKIVNHPPCLKYDIWIRIRRFNNKIYVNKYNIFDSLLLFWQKSVSNIIRFKC